MLKETKVTLYDVFGYLLPGAVLLAALAIVLWSIHFPDEPLALSLPGAESWVLIFAIAYIAGHMAQALSNLLLKALEWPWKRLRSWQRTHNWHQFQRHRWFCSNEHIHLADGAHERLPAEFLNAARTKAAALSGVPEQAIDAEWLFRICDEAVVQRGNPGDREIFVYREGFYRGLCFALVALAAALVVRMAHGGITLALAAGPRKMGWEFVTFFLVTCVVFIFLCFQRFRRFGRYRISQAILAFLVMPEEKKKKEEKKDAD